MFSSCGNTDSDPVFIVYGSCVFQDMHGQRVMGPSTTFLYLYIVLYVSVSCLQFIVVNMSEDQLAEQAELIKAEDEEVERVWKRLGELTAASRRKTLTRLSALMVDPEETDKESGDAKDAQVDVTPAGVGYHPGDSKVHVVTKNLQVETSNKRLKVFSGAKKIANNEVDYKHWKRSATRILEDNDLTEPQKKRIVLQSLTGAAEDLIDLHRGSPCEEIFEILEKLYGSTADGTDLLADFYQIFQLPSQLPSEYLNKLYIHLTEVIALDGMRKEDLSKILLKQFVKGISEEDNIILLKLRLEDKYDSPPSFPDLFVSVRREETKRAERRQRQKQVAKSQVLVANSASSQQLDTSSHLGEAVASNTAHASAHASAEVVRLQQEMAVLKEEMKTMLSKSSGGTADLPGKYGFCYRCGHDGHIAPGCNNRPNRTLVTERKEARRKAQEGTNQGNR